jgi:CRP-like cAMP-binding protein
LPDSHAAVASGDPRSKDGDVKVNETLAKVDMFAALPPAIIEQIVQRGMTREVGPDKVLVRQGAPDSGLQLILDGSASVVVNDVARGTMGEGDYFGEISLIDAAPRSATVVAGPDGVRTFSISPLAFSEILDAHPSVARALLPVLTARIRRIEAALAPSTD